MNVLHVIRWATAILAGLLWAAITTCNGWLAWRTFVRKEERVPSMIPLVGGFIAYVGVTVWPSDSAYKWTVFALALVLDVGSLPYLALALLALYREKRR